MWKVKASQKAADALMGVIGLVAPPPDLTLSQWADKYRYLSPEASAEPGKWRTSRNEPLRGPMDALSDPATQTVVLMTSSQVGKTEVGLNFAGYIIHYDPGPTVALFPTGKMGDADTWSKDRLAPMVRDTPVLIGKIEDAKAKKSGNTILHKTFQGGHLTCVGSNAPSQLAARPLRYVIQEEKDRYPISAGTEGSPSKLIERRQATFWNRKTLKTSTPTLKGASEIEKDYNASDQRRCFVPCPDCGRQQLLRWSNIKWKKRLPDGTEVWVINEKLHKAYEHLPATAQYQCEDCGAKWNDAERFIAISKCEWIASKPFQGVAGFHWWQAYSTFVRLGETVRHFLEALRDGPEAFQVFVNTVLGESYEYAGARVDEAPLYAGREEYSINPLPVGVVVITAGVDVQGSVTSGGMDRLELEIVGWGRGRESWGLEYIVINGDLETQAPWKTLDAILRSRRYRHPCSISDLKIAAAAIDSGGGHTDAVYKFCRPRWGSNIWAIKGQSQRGKPIMGRFTRGKDKHCPVGRVGSDTAKDVIYACFGIKEPGPSYAHLPMSYDMEWCTQVTAEEKISKKNKHGIEYKEYSLRSGRKNEALDCRVYALAALEGLRADLNHLADELKVPVRIKVAPTLEVDAELEITPPPLPGIQKRSRRRCRSRGLGAA